MKIAILGTVGVPGRYGGFETLAENLVRYHAAQGLPDDLTVYCSAKAYPLRLTSYLSSNLRYSRLDANGPQSILYDIICLIDASLRRTDCLILLGVSGAIALPFVRLLTRGRIVTNIDGIEWKREKWRGSAKHFLRWSERLAVRFSHEIVADNQAIADYVRDTYGVSTRVLEYGGNHAVTAPLAPEAVDGLDLPNNYALSLCRIEPENNVAMILQAFSHCDRPFVFVGNWENSEYGRKLRAQYADAPNLYLLDPIYEEGRLRRIRCDAALYVHGHSAGGTNPALVEMMHFGIPIVAFDCVFNRYTTEQAAHYFADAMALTHLLEATPLSALQLNASAMQTIALRRYTWDRICGNYFDLANGRPLLGSTSDSSDDHS